MSNIFSPFPFSCLTNALTTILLGIFVLSKTKRNIVNLTFALLNFVTAIWSLGMFIVIVTTYEQLAFITAKIFYFAVFFIPIFYTHFLLALFGFDKKYKTLISLGYIFGLCLSLLNFTNLIMAGVHPIPDLSINYFAKPGALYKLFLIFFTAYPLVANILVIRGYKFFNPRAQNQYKYILVATALSFIGGSASYAPVMGLSFYPYPNFLVSVYPFIIAYAIIKHHLMDIRLAVTKAGIFFAVYALTLGFPFWIFYTTQNAYLSLAFAMALAFAGPIVHRRLQFKAEETLLAKQKQYQRFLLQAARGMAREHNLQHLLNLIVHVIKRGVRPQFASAFLFDEEHKRYELKALRDHQHMPDKFFLPQDHKLIEAIKQNKKPLGLEDIAGIFAEYSGSPIHLIVPSFSDNKLLGFLALGEKEDHTVYTQDDMNVFSILAQQAAMAIDNCLYMEAAKRNQQRLFEAEKLASVGGMAAGMSHQFKNRLNAFVAASGDVMLCSQYIKEKYAQLLESDPELKDNVEFMDKSVELIGKEVKRCNALVQGIINYARGKTSHELVEFVFEDEIKGVIDLVKIKHQDITQPLPFEFILASRPETKLYCIKGYFSEIIFNLLDNAYEAIDDRIRYHTADAERATYQPQVTVALTKDDDRVSIAVTDNGTGIKEEDKASIFAPFFTTKSSAISGSGMGMYIIKRVIVEQMKGKIWFESEYLKNTTFFIELPQAESFPDNNGK